MVNGEMVNGGVPLHAHSFLMPMNGRALPCKSSLRPGLSGTIPYANILPGSQHVARPWYILPGRILREG